MQLHRLSSGDHIFDGGFLHVPAVFLRRQTQTAQNGGGVIAFNGGRGVVDGLQTGKQRLPGGG